MKKLDTKISLLKQEGGFTLIEMLIVVAIIGILVSIAIPALNSSKTDAQLAKRAAVISAVETAKSRHVLRTTLDLSGSNATLSDFSDLLLVNGVSVGTNVVSLVEGTGKTNINFGTYVDGTSGSGTAAVFLP